MHIHPDWDKWTPEEKTRFLNNVSADYSRMRSRDHPLVRWIGVAVCASIFVLGLITFNWIAVFGGLVLGFAALTHD